MTKYSESLIDKLKTERNIAQANHNDITARTLERVIDMVRRHEEQDHQEAKDFINASGKYEAILEQKLQAIENPSRELVDIVAKAIFLVFAPEEKWNEMGYYRDTYRMQARAAMSALNNCGSLKNRESKSVDSSATGCKPVSLGSEGASPSSPTTTSTLIDRCKKEYSRCTGREFDHDVIHDENLHWHRFAMGFHQGWEFHAIENKSSEITDKREKEIWMQAYEKGIRDTIQKREDSRGLFQIWLCCAGCLPIASRNQQVT